MGESSYEADCPSPFGTTAKRRELNMAGCCHSNSVMGVLTYNGCDSLKRALKQLISMICLCFSLINAEISKLVSEWWWECLKAWNSIMKIYPALLGWLQLCLGGKKMLSWNLTFSTGCLGRKQIHATFMVQEVLTKKKRLLFWCCHPSSLFRSRMLHTEYYLTDFYSFWSKL